MPLDDLVQVIETIQQRIKEHGDTLRQNETRTRMALIDPLLTALGWDVADPGLVTAEYDVSGQRADYALLNASGKPSSFVEAKKLGESLIPHRMQMVNYANMSGVPYAGLTDGNSWELYVVFDQKPLDDRRIMELTIASMPSYRCALEFLMLWKPNLVSGNPVQGHEPVLFGGDGIERVEEASSTASPSKPIDGNWISLAELRSVTGRPAPSAVRFPLGEERTIERWWNLPFEVAQWQIRAGKLTVEACPIEFGRTKYLVNTNPNHSNGTPFNQPRKLSNDLLLDTPYDAETLLKGAKLLCSHFGASLESILLKFG